MSGRELFLERFLRGSVDFDAALSTRKNNVGENETKISELCARTVS